MNFMKKMIRPNFFVLALSIFSLCSCGQKDTSSSNTYNGKVFDISLSQDGSLICTSNRVDNYYSLTISGSGSSLDYASKEKVPWNPIVKKINQVTIEEGITNIGDYFFNALSLDYYLLPSTVVSVGEHSFNKMATIYTMGSLLDNIENDVYYYSVTKPTEKGNYFYLDGDAIVVWPNVPEEPLSFLFVGNSFTYKGAYGTEDNPEVPAYFKKISTNLNIPVNVDAIVKGSHSLTKYSDPNDEMGAILEQKLTANKYDYVILQEQSTTPINNYNTFLSAVKK